jgi:integrase
MIMLPPEAVKPIIKWKTVQAEQRLKCGDCWEEPEAMFTSDTGRRLYISTPTHKWREIQQEYQLKDVPLYSLRHTGASLMIAAGCDVKEVSGRLGHSRTSTTLDTYTHLFEKAQQHTADIMSAAIAEARKQAQ